MKELLLYLIIAVAGLSILGFSAHMFFGGLVEAGTERLIIIAVCLVGALIMAFMGWDVVKRRRS